MNCLTFIGKRLLTSDAKKAYNQDNRKERCSKKTTLNVIISRFCAKPHKRGPNVPPASPARASNAKSAVPPCGILAEVRLIEPRHIMQQTHHSLFIRERTSLYDGAAQNLNKSASDRIYAHTYKNTPKRFREEFRQKDQPYKPQSRCNLRSYYTLPVIDVFKLLVSDKFLF